jgi:hypothetical protein
MSHTCSMPARSPASDLRQSQIDLQVDARLEFERGVDGDAVNCKSIENVRKIVSSFLRERRNGTFPQVPREA